MRRLTVLLLLGLAQAKPVAPGALCDAYPDAPVCAGTVDCALCHTVPPARSVFGMQVEVGLAPDVPRPLPDPVFIAELPKALAAVEAKDADGDGANNLAELLAGSDPNDPASKPAGGACVSDGGEWDVCRYDERYVFKKIHLDVCGHSPTRKALTALADAEDPMEVLHAALDACLLTEFWRGKDGVVWSLANDKIRPLQSVKSGEDDRGDIPLGDYYDDYNFFVWTHTGDRDAREVLTGQYFVRRTEEDGRTVYEPYEPTTAQEFQRGLTTAQLVPKDKRAGMLTHHWFLMSNIMFTAVPRTIAAQAYRAYLGRDIARLEGLEIGAPVPVDFDAKGVDADDCAVCHSTLDPLTYPFTRYEGIQGGDPTRQRLPFTYNATRMNAFVATDGEAVADVPEQGRIFGEDVKDLVEWAAVAADSDEFAEATTLDYWKLFMGAPPEGAEAAEFAALWQAFRGEHEYRVERMLHALIETEAYGVP